MFPIYLGTNDLHRRFYFLYHDGGTHCPKGSLQMCPGSLQCSSMRHCRRGGVQCPCLVQMYPALHSMFVLHFGMHFPINFPFPLTLICTSQTNPGLLLQSSPKVHSDSGSYQFGLPGPKIMLSKTRKDTIAMSHHFQSTMVMVGVVHTLRKTSCKCVLAPWAPTCLSQAGGPGTYSARLCSTVVLVCTFPSSAQLHG